MSNIETKTFAEEIQMRVLNTLKQEFDKAECVGSEEDFEKALANLKEGYKEAFGDKYELFLRVFVGHLDACLYDALS